jgi:hypothetical protein
MSTTPTPESGRYCDEAGCDEHATYTAMESSQLWAYCDAHGPRNADDKPTELDDEYDTRYDCYGCGESTSSSKITSVEEREFCPACTDSLTRLCDRCGERSYAGPGSGAWSSGDRGLVCPSCQFDGEA